MFLVLIFLSFFACSYGSEGYTYRQASLGDLAQLVAFVKSIRKLDQDALKKVVVFPPDFIELFVKKSIEKDQIFICISGVTIVGYKKLFLLNDQTELEDILCNEIRCLGTNAKLVDYAYVDSSTRARLVQNSTDCFNLKNTDLLIYTGADYVHPEFRRLGIARKMYENSLSNTFSNIAFELYERLVLCYGLSKYNDYDIQGQQPSRTSSIVASVVGALNAFNVPYDNKIEHYRYQAFMPQFEVRGKDLVLLPDERGVPGFGNVLVFNFKKD